MKREEIIKLITQKQIDEIGTLSGIGRDRHFLGGPQLAGVMKNGFDIGWGRCIYKCV